MSKIRKAFSLLRYSEGRRGLVLGVAATTEHKAFLQNVEFKTVLDAGANKGQFSLAVCCFHPGTEIIAFEPLQGPARTFSRVFGGNDKIVLKQVALGAVAANADIHVSKREDSSSLFAITDIQTETFHGTEEVNTQVVRVNALDQEIDVSELKKPILLKIDVQGFELELLKGAERSLGAIEHIYCELSFLPLYLGQPLAPEVIQWLAKRGFGLAGVYHIAHNANGRAVQADFHFQKNQSLV